MASTVTLNINGKSLNFLVPDTTMPLLWVLRDITPTDPKTGAPLPNFTGTKFGCGVTACGACTVLVGSSPTKTCTEAVSNFVGKSVVTIEGLATSTLKTLQGKTAAQVQQAWIDYQIPQCGYCQSGMILAAMSLLMKVSQPTDDDINKSIGNICACGTYARVRDVIKILSGQSVPAI